MNFGEKYKNIKKDYVDFIEKEINSTFEAPIKSFLCAPAKRLRPLVGYLFTMSCFKEINDNQRKILFAIELMHNASLFHDDVIDEAKKRRNKKSFNEEFDNNFAVISGDYILSIALKMVLKTNSLEVVEHCTTALKEACIGEFSQYFSKYKTPTLDEYLEKTSRKTSRLFELATLCPILIKSIENRKIYEEKAIEFANNFGLAFQIRDDLLNYLHTGEDEQSGIYTAPHIYKAMDKNDAIAKTVDLIDNYIKKAILALSEFEDSIYKRDLISLTNLLKEDL